MVGSGEYCASSNLRTGDSWSYSMNSNESIVGRRKKRRVSPKCCCGSDAVLFMSGTKCNPNRLFLRCPKFKKNQQRFEGLSDAVDDKVEELEMRLIGLENQLGKSKKKWVKVDAWS
ncbi:hypothetical protein Ahy_A09g045736 [Arachis hypogaea]|uniref:Zinc finger GRF-type domain-containing protein n=1 Tax=Arachis hypogaea TaxID=3818 RepID=A0A445BN18_ARAHY|nr:hypothetical protein Ahy_A09g045736 [Arachis hypogaea]